MFVTIEGLDGAGKDTVLEAITERYPNAVLTSEPSEGEYGKLVRRNLSDESTHALLDFYLFMADRIDHIKNIVEPADQQGRLVVSGRYADSTRAYQPVALVNKGIFESQFEAKHFIEQTMRPWNYEPDLTLYLDISVDTAMERAAGDEKYEKREFLTSVRENYEALAASKEHGSRFARIDAEQSKEAVATAALGRIDVPEPDKI